MAIVQNELIELLIELLNRVRDDAEVQERQQQMDPIWGAEYESWSFGCGWRGAIDEVSSVIEKRKMAEEAE